MSLAHGTIVGTVTIIYAGALLLVLALMLTLEVANAICTCLTFLLQEDCLRCSRSAPHGLWPPPLGSICIAILAIALSPIAHAALRVVAFAPGIALRVVAAFALALVVALAITTIVLALLLSLALATF